MSRRSRPLSRQPGRPRPSSRRGRVQRGKQPPASVSVSAPGTVGALASVRASEPGTVLGSAQTKGSVSTPEMGRWGSVVRSVPTLARACPARVAGSAWLPALQRLDRPAKARSSPASPHCQSFPPHWVPVTASLPGSHRSLQAEMTTAPARLGQAAGWPARLASRPRPQHARSDGMTTRQRRRRPRRRRPWHPVPMGSGGSVAAVCPRRHWVPPPGRRQPSRPRRRIRDTLRRPLPSIDRMRRPRRRRTSGARLL